jgi:hypothetical protein
MQYDHAEATPCVMVKVSLKKTVEVSRQLKDRKSVQQLVGRETHALEFGRYEQYGEAINKGKKWGVRAYKISSWPLFGLKSLLFCLRWLQRGHNLIIRWRRCLG